MQLDGEVRRPWLASREVSLRLKGDIDLAALANAAGLDQRIDGKAQVGADITGPAAAPRIAARVRIPELGLAAVTAQDVTIEGEWGDDKLRVDDIQARLGTGRLRGRLEAVPISTGGATISLDLREVVLPGSLAALGAGTAVAEGRGPRWRHRPDPSPRPPGAASPRRSTAASPRARSLAVRGTLTVDLQEISRAHEPRPAERTGQRLGGADRSRRDPGDRGASRDRRPRGRRSRRRAHRGFVPHGGLARTRLALGGHRPVAAHPLGSDSPSRTSPPRSPSTGGRSS